MPHPVVCLTANRCRPSTSIKRCCNAVLRMILKTRSCLMLCWCPVTNRLFGGRPYLHTHAAAASEKGSRPCRITDTTSRGTSVNTTWASASSPLQSLAEHASAAAAAGEPPAHQMQTGHSEWYILWKAVLMTCAEVHGTGCRRWLQHHDVAAAGHKAGAHTRCAIPHPRPTRSAQRHCHS